MENLDKYEQQAFEVEGSTPAQERNLNQRRAFGRVVNPEFWNIDTTELAEVNEEDLARVEPNYLRGQIFTRRGPLVVGNTGVAFNPAEYSAIVRSPKAFEKAVSAKTQAARETESSTNRRDAAAERSVKHAMENKLGRLTKLEKGLENELSWLKALAKEAKSPGFAHRSEKQLLALAGGAHYLSFANILNVVRIQEGWDEATFIKADAAMAHRLLSGPQRQKVGYWNQMLELAIGYGRAKRAIVRQRMSAIARISGN